MRVHPVRRYAAPSYPTRAYLLEHPELLCWVPKRWRKNPLVLAMLGLALPLVQACTAADDAQGANPAMVRVAPLFVHGDGRGGFGCVAVNPPVFLSEDEAQEVIRDEAKKAGLDFTEAGPTLKDVSLPVTNRFQAVEEWAAKNWKSQADAPSARPKQQKGILALDGYDAKHRVAFEFVSQQDFEAWETKDYSMMATAYDYDLKATAEQLRVGLSKTPGDTIVGVFYEPGATGAIHSDRSKLTWTALAEARQKSRSKLGKQEPNATPSQDVASQSDDREASWESRKKEGKKLGEQELRAQVRDFLAWLKAQGVI